MAAFCHRLLFLSICASLSTIYILHNLASYPGRLVVSQRTDSADFWQSELTTEMNSYCCKWTALNKTEQRRRTLLLVTFYYDLGRVKKGFENRSRNSYLQWSVQWKYISNPVIMFSDDSNFLDEIAQLRGHLPTKLVKLTDRKQQLHVYQKWFNVTAQLSASGRVPYFAGRHNNADYMCAMHSKYELMRQVLTDDQYKDLVDATSYVAWLDMAYFRQYNFSSDTAERQFTLMAPMHLQDDSIAYTMVVPPTRRPATAIFQRAIVWLAGGIFIGLKHNVLQLTQQYLDYLKYFHKQNLTGSDQQIVYAMEKATDLASDRPERLVRLQQLLPVNVRAGNPWSYGGLLARRTGLCAVNATVDLDHFCYKI